MGRIFCTMVSLGLLIPASALAAESPTPGFGADAAITTTLGLIAILGIIFACAWMVRRLNLTPNMRNEHLSMLAVMSLGPKEKIAMINAGGKQLLIGITAQNIRTLHVFEEPVIEMKEAVPSEFAKKLQSILERGEVQ